jgi:hypothetical protein
MEETYLRHAWVKAQAGQEQAMNKNITAKEFSKNRNKSNSGNMDREIQPHYIMNKPSSTPPTTPYSTDHVVPTTLTPADFIRRDRTWYMLAPQN